MRAIARQTRHPLSSQLAGASTHSQRLLISNYRTVEPIASAWPPRALAHIIVECLEMLMARRGSHSFFVPLGRNRITHQTDAQYSDFALGTHCALGDGA